MLSELTNEKFSRALNASSYLHVFQKTAWNQDILNVVFVMSRNKKGLRGNILQKRLGSDKRNRISGNYYHAYGNNLYGKTLYAHVQLQNLHVNY